jgi:lipopolysaccharide/colanic/teichoic acid biosynthesis glycosyltransferase
VTRLVAAPEVAPHEVALPEIAPPPRGTEPVGAVCLPSDARARKAVKRLMDLVLALLFLVVLLPLAVIVAVAIRFDSAGPVFYAQQRVGRGGRVFRMWKFRTMVADAERGRAALLALSRDPNWLQVDDDPRITRVGRYLRRTSLDELPQLLNVVRGQMSLVGPRPLIPLEDQRVPSWARRRCLVAPGMTGLWQVAGRTALSFDEMLRLDCQYVDTWSLVRDAAMLARTLPAVLSRRGAN